MTCPVFTSSLDASLSMTLLPAVLSLTAGSVDVISFLGLGGLFQAHITGNLVILAAHIVNAGEAPVALMLSVSVFVVMLGLTRLVIGGLKSLGLATLRPLLLLQLLLLVAFFILCFSVGSHIDPSATSAILAGMLGASAMAVQHALVRVSLNGSPATGEMPPHVNRLSLEFAGGLLR